MPSFSLLDIMSVIMCLILIFCTQLSLEQENMIRESKGKPILNEAEYRQKVKKERMIYVIILTVGFIVSVFIQIFTKG